MNTNKSGQYVEQIIDKEQKILNYKTFEPLSLNEINYQISENQHKKLTKIYEDIGGLKNLINLNIGCEKKFFRLFNSFYMIKESVKSSQIEGTQCTVEDMFKISNSKQNKNFKIDELFNFNYIKMLEQSHELLEKLPICNQLILKLHSILMQNIRGADELSGKFRASQNWIGPINKKIGLSSSTFIPCSPISIYDHLNELYKFINENNKLDPIIKSGLSHCQFETIHPFVDGNGRIGRALIIFSLMHDKVLDDTYIAPSFFIKAKQSEYYSLLTNVRIKGEFEQWIDFYLNCIHEAISNSFINYKKFVEFYLNKKTLIHESKNKYSHQLLQILELSISVPIFKIDDLAQHLNVAYNSAKKYIDIAIEFKIIIDIKYNNVSKREYTNSILRELFFESA